MPATASLLSVMVLIAPLASSTAAAEAMPATAAGLVANRKAAWIVVRSGPSGPRPWRSSAPASRQPRSHRQRRRGGSAGYAACRGPA